jgi:hypothetical protein
LGRISLLERFERRKASIEVPLLRLLPGIAAKVVNSKTNDPEEVYRQLLDAQRATSEGVRLLPSEVSRIRYEDLRAILLDYYSEHKPRSIIKCYTGDTNSAGNKLTEDGSRVSLRFKVDVITTPASRRSE